VLDLTCTTERLDALDVADAPLLVVAAMRPAGSPDGDADGAAADGSDDALREPVLSDGARAVLGADGARSLRALGFDAAEGATIRVAAPAVDGAPARAVLVVGLGAADRVSSESLRRAAGAAVRAAGDVEALATDLANVPLTLAVPRAVHQAESSETPPVTALAAVTEGLLLAAYRFDAYRSKPAPKRLVRALLVGVDDRAAAEAIVARARIGAEAAMWVRDLVNTPPKDKRPPMLADTVVAGVRDRGLSVRVLDERELEEGGYGGILGVGGGSAMKPRLVELRWEPEGARHHVALVGKGITFDTGGYSLKPTSGQETMKMDMAGAAVAAAVVRAAAELQLPVAVSAVLALAENMISGDAQRVSDVLRMRDGTTVEVLNTDAEGRLVLGDGLAHAVELGADTIIDIATLTGAVVVALGDLIGGVLANDDALAAELIATGRANGEPLWQLPLAIDEYGKRVEGTIADLRNVGTGKDPGTIFGALFLQRFVPDRVRWAHLDIAGIAWRDAVGPYHQKGGTGAPVRTLIAWLEQVSRG
jgi:leucyl aminopeptidase